MEGSLLHPLAHCGAWQSAATGEFVHLMREASVDAPALLRSIACLATGQCSAMSMARLDALQPFLAMILGLVFQSFAAA